MIYQDKPRLKTALEVLRTSMEIEERLEEVRMPFFVMHGEADTVTDPEVSRALYERASSKDKTIKLYPEMWHALTSGEPDHNIDIVFRDIIAWLHKRSSHTPSGRPHDYGIEEFATPASSPQHLRPQARPSYFCGLKGPRLLYHSAM